MSKEERKDPILDKPTSRRDFLKNSGLTVGGLVLGGALGGTFLSKTETVTKEVKVNSPELAQAPAGGEINTTAHETPNYTDALQFFTRQKDFNALSAATECIFPEDEHGPGAIELGVPYFIDKQLASPFGINADDYMKGPFIQPSEPHFLPQIPLNKGDIMLIGIRTLNEISEKDYGNTFDKLTEEQQIEILTLFESNQIQMNKVASGVFFGLLRQMTIEGAYSDPMYGGNRNMAGWIMKEFPGAQISYAHVIDSEEFVLIEPRSISGHSHNS